MSEWISVEDYLPSKSPALSFSEEVIVYNGAFCFIAKCDYSNNRFIEATSYDSLVGVTHWMPLPKPPS